MSALEMAWTTGWTRTLILKETWLFLTKQQFSQKSTYRSAATAPGRVGPLKTRHPLGTATMKTSWRPNLSCTDRLLYHSLGPKNTAPVGLHIYCKQTKGCASKVPEVDFKWTCVSLVVQTRGLLFPVYPMSSTSVCYQSLSVMASRWSGDWRWLECAPVRWHLHCWVVPTGRNGLVFFFFNTFIYWFFIYRRVISSLMLIQTPRHPLQQ